MSTTDVVAEVSAWLEANWDPDLTVAEWWERLGTSGWAVPSWPEEWFGKGLPRAEALRVAQAIADFGALAAPGGLGTLLAGPTIYSHGDDDQKRTYLRDIVTGKQAWCQLFSEPGAGSDLAGLNCKAEKDGDEWVVNGQKVWTSGGHWSDLGMLLARTDPDVPKHQGITWFAFDMHQPGVEVRPLKELTGQAIFNEVFLTDARVATASLIGGRNNGWAVANTTLGHERASLGSGGTTRGGSAVPGTIGGNLSRRAGDFAPTPAASTKGSGRSSGSRGGAMYDVIVGIAKGNGKSQDALVRQDLVRLYSLSEIGRVSAERVKAARAAGTDIAGMANIAKLSMSMIVRLTRDLGLRVVGNQGMLHGYDQAEREVVASATGNPFLNAVTNTALYAQAPPIYGGTDQIQRNIIGERVLGLPKEPGNERDTPFSQLPKNA